MTVRRARLLLHWTTGTLIVWVWLAPAPVPNALLAVAAGLLVGLVALRGLGSAPGPALGGAWRRFHPWHHRALYAGIALSGAVALATLSGRGGELLHDVVGWMVAAGSLHAVFHLWRHTALRDGALRRMTPSALHRLL